LEQRGVRGIGGCGRDGSCGGDAEGWFVVDVGNFDFGGADGGLDLRNEVGARAFGYGDGLEEGVCGEQLFSRD
jgi:hypothetical protein